MAGSTVTSPIKETDVTVLKETLRSQQQLLQKLYAELDVEREAASTATNEALSMILRLQGEKAAMKMEASQYKRLAEEKISHAEESLEIFEELMYQKEMEISALEFQIESYKYKLLSLGCEHFDDIDNKFSDHPFGERNDSSYGEKGIRTHMRRLSSLPSLLPTSFYKTRTSSSEEKQETQMLDVGSSIDATNTDLVVRDHSMDSRKSSMEFNSIWEQIRALDEKVKEISDCKEVSNKKFPNIKVKPTSRSTSPTKPKLPPTCQKIMTCEESSEKATSNSANSTNTIHDVFEVHCKFEVPESSKKNKSCFSEEKNKGKAFVEEDNRLKKPDMFMIGSPEDDDIDCFNKDEFLSLKTGKTGYKLRALMSLDPDPDPDPDPYLDYESSVEYNTEWTKMNNLVSGKHEKRSCRPSDETNDDRKPAILRRSNRTLNHRSSELHHLTQRVEQLEGRGYNRMHEISEGREDELNMLMHLREQLNSIQSEMRSWRPKKSSPADEVTLVPLIEVMLGFWL